MTISADEPDWNVLCSFGLPMNMAQSAESHFPHAAVIENIITASSFLIENRSNINYHRYFDAFKAMLLALKIHYPSKFSEIEKQAGINLSDKFNLDNISGRDIKLRNICLTRIAEYYKI